MTNIKIGDTIVVNDEYAKSGDKSTTGTPALVGMWIDVTAISEDGKFVKCHWIGQCYFNVPIEIAGRMKKASVS